MATVPIARSRATSAAPATRPSWVARRPLVAYFALAYAATWACWLPYYLGGAGLGLLPFAPPNLLVLLGQYGPTAAAFAVAAATGGRPAVRALLRRYGQWRAHPGWYLLVVVAPPLLFALAVLARVGLGPLGALGQDGPSILLAYLLDALALKLVLGGALGEEGGWRGFALPRLQARHGALGASLILGALWAGWHAPLYLSASRVANNPPLLFVAGVVAMAVTYTWVANRTGGSLPVAILLHAAINSAPAAVRDLAPGMAAGEFFALLIAGYVGVALLLVVATRGRLGYRPERATPSATPPRQVADAAPLARCRGARG